jgi:hypothetical protein
MAAAISHELNQPLTGIRNYARNAFYMIDQKAGGEADVKNNLRLISEQVDRAARIITQMRELTRRSDSVFAHLDLNSVIRESVEFLLPQMKLSEVEVALALAEDDVDGPHSRYRFLIRSSSAHRSRRFFVVGAGGAVGGAMFRELRVERVPDVVGEIAIPGGVITVTQKHGVTGDQAQVVVEIGRGYQFLVGNPVRIGGPDHV